MTRNSCSRTSTGDRVRRLCSRCSIRALHESRYRSFSCLCMPADLRSSYPSRGEPLCKKTIGWLWSFLPRGPCTHRHKEAPHAFGPPPSARKVAQRVDAGLSAARADDWINRGDVAFRAEALEMAHDSYRRAADLDRRNIGALRGAASAAAALGRLEEEISWLRASVARQSRSSGCDGRFVFRARNEGRPRSRGGGSSRRHPRRSRRTACARAVGVGGGRSRRRGEVGAGRRGADRALPGAGGQPLLQGGCAVHERPDSRSHGGNGAASRAASGPRQGTQSDGNRLRLDRRLRLREVCVRSIAQGQPARRVRLHESRKHASRDGRS